MSLREQRKGSVFLVYIMMDFFGKKIVGIDIGNDSIKVVELSSFGGRKKLENYAEVKSLLVSKDPLLVTNEEGHLVANNVIATALKEIMREAKINTKKAVFSLPDFLTFAASFEIPPMPENEIARAVSYNASRYLTLPTDDVTLDWRIVSPSTPDKKSGIKIFLIAVPNKTIKAYQELAALAGLDLVALNPEIFGMAKVLPIKNTATACFMDLGEKTSTVNIVDNGHVKRSYSFNFSGGHLSSGLANSINISIKEAEKIKITEGMLSKKESVVKTLQSFADQFFADSKNVLSDFLFQEKKEVSEFYLVGGTANMPGLSDYAKKIFGKPVHVANCFLDIAHPKVLEKSLFEMSPRYAGAVGVALEFAE